MKRKLLKHWLQLLRAVSESDIRCMMHGGRTLSPAVFIFALLWYNVTDY